MFAIIAFATTSGFDTTVKLNVTCDKLSYPIERVIEYPFKQTITITRAEIHECLPVNAANDQMAIELDYKTSAEFYVTVGVLSMLYSIAALAVYMLLSALYENNHMIPFIDLIGTGILTLFWFIGWCAWVANEGNVKNFCGDLHNSVGSRLVANGAAKSVDDGNFASLTISLVSISNN